MIIHPQFLLGIVNNDNLFCSLIQVSSCRKASAERSCCAIYNVSSSMERTLIFSWTFYINFVARRMNLKNFCSFYKHHSTHGGLASQHASQGSHDWGICLQVGLHTEGERVYIQGVCIQRGLHPVGLHPGGICIQRGSASRGVCLWGVCIQGGWADPPMGYYKIRSTSRQYTSYWNTFLWYLSSLVFHIQDLLSYIS